MASIRKHLLSTLLLSALAVACSSSDDGGVDPAAPDGGGNATHDAAPDGAADAQLGDTAPDPADVVQEAAEWTSGPIHVVEEPLSQWHVSLEGEDVIARREGSDVALLVDPTSTGSDGRYAGVYVFVAGAARLTGTYNGFLASMFVPDRPYVDQTSVTIVAAGDSLSVEMTEGSLSEMVDAQFPSDEPFRWASTWSLAAGGLRVTGAGLYYLLLPMDGCALALAGEAGVPLGTLDIEASTSPFLQYFDEVRAIEVTSPTFGTFSVGTDAAILQVEVPSYPDTAMFELDFDHSFKDRGQLVVNTEVVVPLTP